MNDRKASIHFWKVAFHVSLHSDQPVFQCHFRLETNDRQLLERIIESFAPSPSAGILQCCKIIF